MKKLVFLFIIALVINLNLFAIEPPNLIFPDNGSMDINPEISLLIDHVDGAEYYDFQADTSINFDSPNLIEHTIDASYYGKVFKNLHFDEKYYWHVKTRSTTETSIWSNVWDFTVTNTIIQNSPATGTTDVNPQKAIFIHQKPGIDHYDYQIDTVASFDSPLLE